MPVYVNQLTRLDAPLDADLLPIYSSANSDLRAVTLQTLAEASAEIAFPGGTVGSTVTADSVLPDSALGSITPVDSATSTTQTLPSAATAWAASPYGVVVLVQRGVGVPAFAAGAGDTLRATSGIGACVQYGMIAAQVQSETEWALA